MRLSFTANFLEHSCRMICAALDSSCVLGLGDGRASTLWLLLQGSTRVVLGVGLRRWVSVLGSRGVV